MDIRVSKESDVPVRQQLAEQIAFLIATDKLKAGDVLPSVRELARRLGIHHNTVSHAYQDLVRRTWLLRRRGTRIVVRSRTEQIKPNGTQDLDELIAMTIQTARERGYSLQELRERMRERLMDEPPDHILVVEQDAGLQRLLQEEIREALGWPVECCARENLTRNSGCAIGALVVTPQYAAEDVKPLVPKAQLMLSIAFSSADEHVERIRQLAQPSVIAVVSISANLLRTARSLLAPALGRRHTLCEYLLPLESLQTLGSADVIFCDSIAIKQVKGPKAVHYRVIAPDSVAYLSSAVASYQHE
ncbi:MAG: GntR family transcriptional regulator [Terriglobia bacterium]